MEVKLVDSHIHLHEYGDGWKGYCTGKYLMIAVSDDVESSFKTVDLGKKCSYVIPAVGIHPWNVGSSQGPEMVKTIENIIVSYGIRFLGEVGLDRIFHLETFSAQLGVFEEFLRVASEYNLGVSVHAAGAWREVLELLKKYRIPAAVFHWYTGPLDLVDDILDEGYFIGINPAISIQKKHEEVLKRVPLESILTESDGPYRYRGMVLGPDLLNDLVMKISEVKSVDPGEVISCVLRNFEKLFSNTRRTMP